MDGMNDAVIFIGITLAVIFYSLAVIMRRRGTPSAPRERLLIWVFAALGTFVLVGAIVYRLAGGE
jgi:hypothetical protein